MKPAICEKHGIQNFVVTSSDFVLSIDEGKIPGPIDACKIKTSAFERLSENFVSRHFFQRFFKGSEISEVHLIDREKNLKKMNDRLLIRKIFSDSDLKYVCPACLHQFLKNSNQLSVRKNICLARMFRKNRVLLKFSRLLKR